MNLIKKSSLFLTFLLTLLALNLQGEEEKKESEWSEIGDLWRPIPKTQWHFKIQNQARDGTILTLKIIQDKDLNSKKTPIVKLEAASNQTESVVKEINLPASYHIQVERKRDKCKWDFEAGSLLRTWYEHTFLSKSNNPQCGFASGTMQLEYNKDKKTGELIFILDNVEEIQNIKELN